MKTIKNIRCRMCESSKFTTVINMGKQPLVNSLITKKNLKKTEFIFPLHVKQCNKCKLVQLVEIIDANEIYKNVDYLYFSSDMPGLNKYFEPYANDLKKRFIKKNDFVLEIGCNDGIMLKYFVNEYRALGVDPATNVAIRALNKGIQVLPLFFSEELSKKIKNEFGLAKLIYGNNCIAHLNDIRDLINGVNILLDKKGTFVLECNYWGGMVKNINYSLIYHDHYSYFSLYVWEKFLKKYKMKVFDALVTPAQGGSLRLFICKDNRKSTRRKINLFNEEKLTKLNTHKKSKEYKINVNLISNKLYKIIVDLKKRGKKIAGYGAAAKGMTILQKSKIGKKHIDYFVDDSPAKQGYFTPIDHIPIISRKESQKKLPDYFIILAPNYSEVIIAKERNFIKKGGKFIVPKNDIEII